ncbi:hypothetical protein [Vibrio lentus]|uniref:hypothetical protein n=1 Tax=Vibrio lentus TaxID=136468 RepID=UPI000976416C|nr:hypothetical protein [Vibrio lentus]OMO22339.1 hypothetical protein BH583_09185 [Vibrio lentus]
MSNQSKTPRQQEEIRTLMCDLLSRAMTINQTTIHDVFFNYSGHVDGFDFYVHINGHNNSDEATHPSDEVCFYLDFNSMKSIKAQFKACHSLLDSLAA